MKVERTFGGLEVRLKPTGKGRFFSAGFLVVWLAFWAAGEAFALWIIGVGAWSLLTGNPPWPDRTPLTPAPALAVGAFLIIWTAIWTVGGFAALQELLRLLTGEDRLRATPYELEFNQRPGLLSRRRIVPRERLRRLYRLASGSALMAETLDGTVELTRLGSAADHATVIEAFSAEMKLVSAATLPPALPPDWLEVTAPNGAALLVRHPATRRTQARAAWLFTLPLAVVAVLLADAARRDLNWLALAAIVAALAGAAAWGSLWLSHGRTEWRLDPGRVTQQRRWGARVREVFTGTGIRLSDSRDGDGDTWFEVAVTAPTAPGATPREKRRAQRVILNRIHDATEPRQLAAWLAARTGLVVTDTTTPAAKAADLADLKRQLAATGRFGRWAARLLDRLGPGRNDPGQSK